MFLLGHACSGTRRPNTRPRSAVGSSLGCRWHPRGRSAPVSGLPSGRRRRPESTGRGRRRWREVSRAFRQEDWGQKHLSLFSCPQSFCRFFIHLGGAWITQGAGAAGGGEGFGEFVGELAVVAGLGDVVPRWRIGGEEGLAVCSS